MPKTVGVAAAVAKMKVLPLDSRKTPGTGKVEFLLYRFSNQHKSPVVRTTRSKVLA